MKVQKRGANPKPFKSGLKVNTVKGVKINPYTGRLGYTFLEDDSIVDQRQCVEVLDVADLEHPVGPHIGN